MLKWISKTLSVHRRRTKAPNSHAGPATHKVLRLPELLEAIISQLPASTILTTAMRVSRLWNTVVDESPSLSKMLSLPTASDKVAVPRRMMMLAGDDLSPLYDETLKFNSFIGKLCPDRKPSAKIPWVYVYKQQYEGDLERWPENHTGVWIIRVRQFADDPRSEHQAWAEPNATWRRMLMTNPPCSVIHASLVQCLGDDKEPYIRMRPAVNFSIRETAGITLGLLEDVFARVTVSPVQFGIVGHDSETHSNGLKGGAMLGLLMRCGESNPEST